MGESEKAGGMAIFSASSALDGRCVRKRICDIHHSSTSAMSSQSGLDTTTRFSFYNVDCSVLALSKRASRCPTSRGSTAIFVVLNVELSEWFLLCAKSEEAFQNRRLGVLSDVFCNVVINWLGYGKKTQ